MLDFLLAFFVAFDGPAALVVPDTFEVDPDGDNDDVYIADDGPVDTDEDLQVDSRGVDSITHKDETNDVGSLSESHLLRDFDLEHLEEADSAWHGNYLETIRKLGKAVIICPIYTISMTTICHCPWVK